MGAGSARSRLEKQIVSASATPRNVSIQCTLCTPSWRELALLHDHALGGCYHAVLPELLVYSAFQDSRQQIES